MRFATPTASPQAIHSRSDRLPPEKNSNPKQINHADKDVVCHVVKGSGRLRIDGKRIPLKPGTICHIPKGTLHDFAAGRRNELILFYSLIKTG